MPSRIGDERSADDKDSLSHLLPVPTNLDPHFLGSSTFTVLDSVATELMVRRKIIMPLDGCKWKTEAQKE